VSEPVLDPRFPVYIPSKNRADVATTPRRLELMRVPYKIIVEQAQYGDYAANYHPDRLLVLPPEYQRDYHTGDDLGDTRSKGPGPARNFAWDHAMSLGYDWHWVMDDNINCWGRLHANQRIRAASGWIFAAMEDFCLRYTNVGMAGPEYMMFLPSREARKHPYSLNKRIFSCNLIRNEVTPRWRGRYNEDLDLSIMVLRAGWCTVKFTAFWQEKRATQRIRGGNTEDFYAKEGGGGIGTLAKSQLAAAMHPDIVKVVWKFNRWHHEADFSEFEDMHLIRDPAWQPPEVNPYQIRRVPDPNFRRPLNGRAVAPRGDTRLPAPRRGRMGR
jgi:TET-Associated Glycosyltransferase